MVAANAELEAANQVLAELQRWQRGKAGDFRVVSFAVPVRWTEHPLPP